MIADSEKGLFRHLIVHKLDRFSRDKYDAVTFKRKLKMNGVTIHSVLENLDGSPESLILESLLEGMAQYYSMNLAREVAKGMKETGLQAKSNGGKPPLGYDLDADRRYVINEQEAAVVRHIFTKYGEGVGYNEILRFLNGRGYKTKAGNPFGKNSLNSILHNMKYTGVYVFNRRCEKDVSGKRNPQVKPREEWIVVENGVPAIIDQDTFDAVQAKLTRNLMHGGSFKAKEIYLLSGLTYCGECGSGMYGNTRYCGRNKSKYSSYRCSDRAQHKGCSLKELRKEYLENYVLDQLYQKLFSGDAIHKLSAMLSAYNQRMATESNTELTLASGELTEVTGKISAIIRLVSESGISIETVKTDMKLLEDRKHFLENYIRDITLSAKAAVVSDEMICDLITRSQEFVRTKNIAECRHFIQSYIDKVVVSAEKVEVFFKIHVPDEDSDTASPLTCEEGIKVLQKVYKEAI
jgi:site-specific DNA recombinase